MTCCEAERVDLPLNIGNKLISHAVYRLKNQEYNTAILLSGAAMDCRLSELYKKWRHIRDLGDYAHPYEPEKTSKEIEEELLGIRGFKQRVASVTGLLTDKKLEEYVKGHLALASKIQDDFPSVSLGTVVSDIERLVMWKRNHIIHVGDFQYSHDDANRSINFARLFLLVLENLDQGGGRVT